MCAKCVVLQGRAFQIADRELNRRVFLTCASQGKSSFEFVQWEERMQGTLDLNLGFEGKT